MNDDGEGRDVESLVRLAGARPRLPEEEVAPVKAAARAAWRREVRRTRRRHLALGARWAFGGAALATGLLIAVLGIFRTMAPPLAGTLAMQSGEVAVTGLQAGRGLEAGGVVATGTGGRAALRLADGPSLRIDADSEVRLESARRVVLVRGAVYVDADPAAPVGDDLVVATPLGSIEHLGTQFEARLSPVSETGPAGALRVTVREGTVRVTLAGGALTAGAGTALTVQPDGAVRRAPAAPHGPAWDWVQRTAPPLDIEGATLTAFLGWTSREIGLPWQVAEGARRQPAGEVVLHGSIAGLTPLEALTVVLPSCGLRHRRTDRALVLEPAAGGPTAPSGSRTTAAGPPS